MLADPPNWQRAAGLITYYNRHKFHAALVTREGGERVVTLVSCLGDWPGEALTFHGRYPVGEGKVTLGVTVDRAAQRAATRRHGSDLGNRARHVERIGRDPAVCPRHCLL